MGRKLDALLGRRPKPSNLKGTARLAVSRLPTLKLQRQARCSTARSDVVEFLKNANRDRALLRVEQVIKEQNMLDVFVALEGYCNLLVERVNLFEQEKFCPDELIEAVSGLIYASTRCGDFPELQELRAIFTSKFGKEFVLRAVELRNNCGVNPRVIQKLSTRTPSLENKMEVLKEIASDNNIELELPISDTKVESSKDCLAPGLGNSQEDDEVERGPRRQYKDVADAAQAAFESAAYAAAAARAAVELSRSESTDDPPTTPKIVSTKFDKIHPHDSENKGSLRGVSKGREEFKPNEGGTLGRRSFSSSSSSSSSSPSPDEEGDIKGKNIVVDESDCDVVEGSKRGEFGGEEKRSEGAEPLNISRKPISVRSRWAHPR